MKLIPLPAFTDNYVWMLHDGREALVVDPGDAQPVLAALQREDVRLRAILVTHDHDDHTGGIGALRAATQARVLGPAPVAISGSVAPAQRQVCAGGTVLVLLGLAFEVLAVPGHTANHIAWYCAKDARTDTTPLLFCGDTLFSGGCGRLLGGSAEQLHASLQLLAALPGETRVCCAHEYTLSNLKFARELEPDNAELMRYYTQVQALRHQGLPTLPSSIALERQINPFLRSHLPPLIAAARHYDAQGVDTVGVFATLRQWKNQYR